VEGRWEAPLPRLVAECAELRVRCRERRSGRKRWARKQALNPLVPAYDSLAGWAQGRLCSGQAVLRQAGLRQAGLRKAFSS